MRDRVVFRSRESKNNIESHFMPTATPTGQQRYASLIEWARRTIAYSRAVASPEFTQETFDLVYSIEESRADAILNHIREEIRNRRGEELSYTAAALELIPAVLEVVRKTIPATLANHPDR